MAELSTGTEAVRVVTLRTFLGVGGQESSGLESNRDLAQRSVTDRYDRAVAKLAAETAKASANVLITVQDRDASMLQSKIAEANAMGGWAHRFRQAALRHSLAKALPAATCWAG